MPSFNDVYQDEDGNFWQFDPPYDEDEDFLPTDDELY